MKRIDRIHKFLGEPPERVKDVETIIYEAFRAGVHYGKRDATASGGMPSVARITEALDEWREEPMPNTYLSIDS